MAAKKGTSKKNCVSPLQSPWKGISWFVQEKMRAWKEDEAESHALEETII
jgi:hypothetical protein